jgi:hypothetical protein
VRCRRYLGCRVQLGQQRLSLGTSQLLTALVQPPRAFLKRVVVLKDGAHSAAMITGVGVGTSKAASAL